MKKNNLMEAAAEILKGSLASAPKDAPKKLEGSEIEDLGGDTPQEHSDKKLEVGAKAATPPGKQPDSDTKEALKKLPGSDFEVIDPSHLGEATDEESELEERTRAGIEQGDLSEEWKQSISEDVQAILASETGLPKEFSSKIATIYEARVTDKISTIVEEIEADYAEKFEAAVIEVRDNLTEQVNDYLDYVVEEWMKNNEIAIEKGLRSELTEEFIGGLRNLFLEHYIDIPAEKVDLVDELATKVEELTGELNEEVAKSVELKKQLGESKKVEILQGVCEGLTQTQIEKVRSLAESVELTAEGDYKGKLVTIRENYFPTTTGKKIDAKVLTEAQEPLTEDKPTTFAEVGVSAVAAAISRTNK